MATDVVMPQMGESIAEGTIVRWIKKVGESVERDEPLFEISTDKVDAEIPSPVAGVVTEIRAKEGETVPVNSVVAVIGAPGSAASVTASQPASVTSSQPAPSEPVSIPPSQPAAAPPAGVAPARPAPPAPPPAASASPAAALRREPGSVSESRKPERVPESAEDAIRQRSSPLVRKIAKEHKTPKFKVRLRNRCHLCGRPRAFLRKFGLCRLCFRKLALEGDIAGVTKSSW